MEVEGNCSQLFSSMLLLLTLFPGSSLKSIASAFTPLSCSSKEQIEQKLGPKGLTLEKTYVEFSMEISALGSAEPKTVV